MHDNNDPILIISGDDACYNALNDFASAFSYELTSLGYKNIVRDIFYINPDLLDELIKDNYRAIVGFQTNLFTLRLPAGRQIGEVLTMPKYNFIFDPPANKLSFYSYDDPSMNLLLCDDGYIEFINTYFSGEKKVHYLPPGGGLPQDSLNTPEYSDRKYDLTFMGTYYDYRGILQNAITCNPDFSGIILDFFQYLLDRPNTSAEHAIVDFLSDNGISMEKAVFLKLFEILYASEKAVSSYYRELIIRTFLSRDIRIDVFSDSWQNAPFADHKNLFIHDDVSYRDTFQYLSKSKLSLNIFSWHKSMMSERIANIMLSGAVCISDYSHRLNALFKNNEDIILFDLEKPDDAADLIINLLNDDEKRQYIAKAGYDNALNNHTWKKRVEMFIDLLETVSL